MEPGKLELIKIIAGLFAGSGGLAFVAYKIAVAYIQRNEKRQLRVVIGKSEFVLTGHTAEEEALIIRQLANKALLQKGRRSNGRTSLPGD